MEEETIIAVSVLSGVCLLLLVLIAVLFSRVTRLHRRVEELQGSSWLRVQKLKLENDKNHAFHNPAISPDEELARRGFSMYAGEDAESGRLAPTERQTGGQFVEELARELDHRQQRRQQSQPPTPPYQRPQHNQPSAHQNQPSAHQNQPSAHQNQPSAYQNQPLPQQNQPSAHQNQSSLHKNQQSRNQAPPFLLQSIEENKTKSRNLANPIANVGNGRQSDTNPNFIY